MAPPIGIDLGTTFSCVGVWRHSTVEIIPDLSTGSRTVPSCVAFDVNTNSNTNQTSSSDPPKRLIGESAANQAARNPANTIFDAKRLIGRSFYDECVQKDMELWPFKVVCKSDEVNDIHKPMISVKWSGSQSEKRFEPEQISAMVLSHLKESAEAYLGSKASKQQGTTQTTDSGATVTDSAQQVTDAVITVPAYFNDSQRQATKDAGRIAGLNVLRILNEPTAAAIAYGLNRSGKGGSGQQYSPNSTRVSGSAAAVSGTANILVYDLGGGTFDVSLLQVDDEIFEVKATAGDTHLGGQDFDNKVLEFCVAELHRKMPETKKSPLSQRALRRLRTQAERAKRTLSSSTTATIEVDSLVDGKDFSCTITRAKFETMIASDLAKTLELVEDVVRQAGMQKKQVDEIVLVGGSTRVPKVRELLKDYFSGKTLCSNINPDEAVAYGAAVQAAILKGGGSGSTDSSSAPDVLLIDVTPLSLGVETQGGVFTKVISRNKTLPCSVTRGGMSTSADDQSSVLVKVFEGERALTKDNNLLGTFALDGIPAMPRGVPKVEVKFSVDTDGILSVSAVADHSNSPKRVQNELKIRNEKGRLSPVQIDRMVKEADDFKLADEQQLKIVKSRNALENYCYNTKNIVENFGYSKDSTKKKVPALSQVLPEKEKTKILDAIDKELKWIIESQSVTNSTQSISAFETRLKDLERLINPLITSAYERERKIEADIKSGAILPSDSDRVGGGFGQEIDEKKGKKKSGGGGICGCFGGGGKKAKT